MNIQNAILLNQMIIKNQTIAQIKETQFQEVDHFEEQLRYYDDYLKDLSNQKKKVNF